MSLKRVSEILESLRGLACPHCGAGRDPNTVGLVWEALEQNWRCPICGYRVREPEKPQFGVDQQNVPGPAGPCLIGGAS